jgi:phosphoribosylformylglycinamidine cyclo-ligase
MRVVPKGLRLAVDWSAWERPALFQYIQRLGDVPEEDMRRTFNLGLGLIMLVAKSDADGVLRLLKRRKDPGVVMGEVVRA